jgi:hypothetical protein
MFASVGTLAIAGWTTLSTGYVATEIIISHHTLYIWPKQTNKQTNKHTGITKMATNGRNMKEVYSVYNTLSYTYVHLLV